MKFKYFQITDKEALDQIEQCLVSIEVRNAALNDLANKFGAFEVLKFRSGDVAGFCFVSRPDKAIWKSVKHGFMPKAKTAELSLLNGIPKAFDYKDIIKKYGFGGEMIVGDQVSGGGFRLHSSHIKGNRKTGFYVIKVPYQNDFDMVVDSSLIEIKEWEMIKEMDSQP